MKYRRTAFVRNTKYGHLTSDGKQNDSFFMLEVYDISWCSQQVPLKRLYTSTRRIKIASRKITISFVSNKKLSSRRQNENCKQTMHKMLILVHFLILGGFISFVLPICLSVRQHGTTRLPLQGFSRSLHHSRIFRKPVKKILFTLQF